MANRIKMNVLTVGNQDFEIHDEAAHGRIDEFGNVPFITHEEDAELELPVNTIRDDEVDEESTWSSNKIQNEISEALQANIQAMESKITEALTWKYATETALLGYVWCDIPSDAKEIFLYARITSGSAGNNSIGFHLPIDDILFYSGQIHDFVNHYSSTIDGYAKIGIRMNGNTKQVALRQLWNGTSLVTGNTYWRVFYR